MFLLLFTNALFSLTYIIISYGLKYGHPILLLMYRMLFSGFSIILFQYIYNKSSLYIKKKDYIYLFSTCLLHMYINFLSETYALQNIEPFTVSIFYLISPICSAILDYLFTGNKLSKKQIAIILIGTALAISVIIMNTEITTLSILNYYYYILLFISIISSILAWYQINYIIQKENYSLITINGYASILSGFLFFITALHKGILFNTQFQNNFILMSSGIGVGIVGNIIGYNLYGVLLKQYNITTILFVYSKSVIILLISAPVFFSNFVAICSMVKSLSNCRDACFM